MEKFNRTLRSSQQEDTRPNRKNTVIILLLFLLLAVGVLAVIMINKNKKRVYDSYEIIHTAELLSNSSVNYTEYDGGYIRYDRDGAQAYTAEGSQRWNIAYNLKNPIIAVCEPYTAIADKGDRMMYIVDASGTVSQYELAEKISQISVAGQGVTAVMTTGSTEDHIYLYEPGSSAMLIDIMTQTENHGFPIAMAISRDGRKLVTSYLSMAEGDLTSWVTFYNFGEVGQNYIDNMVGSYSFEALVPEVKFVTNEIAVVVRDDGLVLYQMTEIPKVQMKEDFTTEIRSVFYSGAYTGVVLKSAGQTADQLRLYQNSSGKKILDMPLNLEYSRVYTAGSDIVFYGGLQMTILNTNGQIKLQTDFNKNINHIFRVDDTTRYLLIGDQTAELVELKELKNSNE